MTDRVVNHRLRVAGVQGKAAVLGVDASAAVMSESDLNRMAELGKLDSARRAEECAIAERRRERHEAAQARASTWTGTVDGMRRGKLEAMQQRKDDAERRRELIDREEAELRARQHDEEVRVAQEKMLRRDPRFAALQSQQLLDAVISEQEEQKVLSARKREFAKQREQYFFEQAMSAERAREEAEERKRADAKQRARAAAADFQTQMEQQRAARVAERAARAEEGREIRARAEAAAAEERAKEQQRKQDARELAYFHAQQANAQIDRSPRRSARNKLEARLAADPDDDACRKFAEMKAMQYEEIHRREQESRVRTSQMIDAVASKLDQLPSPRRDVAKIEQGPSISDKITAGDQQRKEKQRDGKSAYARDLDMLTSRGSRAKHAASEAESARRDAIARQLRTLEHEEREMKEQLRDEAKYLEYIQRLQAAEKAAARHQEAVREREEGRAMVQALRDEEQLVETMLRDRGSSLSPRLTKHVFSPRSGFDEGRSPRRPATFSP